MITIQSGKMIIPEEERFVGFAGDDQSSTKQFILPQTRITDVNATVTLYLRFDDDSVTSAPLTISIVDSDTILTWNIRSQHLLRPGIVMAQIKVTAGNGTVTHYSWDYFVVGASAEFAGDGSEIDMLSRTEFEERLVQTVRDARATAPYIGADGYWYVYSSAAGAYVRSYSANNVTVDSAVSDSSANPVENRAVKAYVDAADSSKVDKTTRVAGHALSGNISADDLYESLAGKINPPLVTVGVSSGYPAQYGKTSDGTPVFCQGLSRWIPLAKAEDLPTKTSDLTNDSGFLTQHQDISGKMALCSQYVPQNAAHTAPNYALSDFTDLPVGQLFRCQLGESGQVETTYWIKTSSSGAARVALSGDIPNVSGNEDASNKVTSLSSASTDAQYPSAKCVYDLIGDVESVLASLL